MNKMMPVRIRHTLRSIVYVVLALAIIGCKQVLYSGLTEKDVNEMIAILEHSGIKASKQVEKDDLYALVAESDNFGRAVDVLKEHGYPKESYESMGDVFKKEGLISSPLEERVRFIYALSQNVAETLTQIDGVITARVHIVLPENNPFDETIKPSSASVFIKYHPEIDLISVKSDIKLIVEKSIEGLTYDKVTVVMLPAKKVGALAQEALQQEGPSILKWLLIVILVIIAALAVLRYRLRKKLAKPAPKPKARPITPPEVHKAKVDNPEVANV